MHRPRVSQPTRDPVGRGLRRFVRLSFGPGTGPAREIALSAGRVRGLRFERR